MAGEPRANYVGPPDFDAGGRCGFSVDLSAPRCESPAEWHLYGSSAWGDVASRACEHHVRAAILAMDGLYGAHPFGAGCRGPESIWLDDHCDPPPAVPSTTKEQHDQV